MIIFSIHIDCDQSISTEFLSRIEEVAREYHVSQTQVSEARSDDEIRWVEYGFTDSHNATLFRNWAEGLNPSKIKVKMTEEEYIQLPSGSHVPQSLVK